MTTLLLLSGNPVCQLAALAAQSAPAVPTQLSVVNDIQCPPEARSMRLFIEGDGSSPSPSLAATAFEPLGRDRVYPTFSMLDQFSFRFNPVSSLVTAHAPPRKAGARAASTATGALELVGCSADRDQG